jgi:hypothetical protein
MPSGATTQILEGQRTAATRSILQIREHAIADFDMYTLQTASSQASATL